MYSYLVGGVPWLITWVAYKGLANRESGDIGEAGMRMELSALRYGI